MCMYCNCIIDRVLDRQASVLPTECFFFQMNIGVQFFKNIALVTLTVIPIATIQNIKLCILFNYYFIFLLIDCITFKTLNLKMFFFVFVLILGPAYRQ